MSARPVRIAIFASGSGSNAQALIEYFNPYPEVTVGAIFTNRPKAGVISVGEAYRIPVYTFKKRTLYEETQILNALFTANIDLVVLAGFLLLMPPYLVKAFRGRIVNLHPALLPNSGGKGMYGKAVHEAVKAHGDQQTGITIHHVNEAYDEGQIIRQFTCEVDPVNDSAEDIESRVHSLEHTYYPPTVREVIEQEFDLDLTSKA